MNIQDASARADEYIAAVTDAREMFVLTQMRGVRQTPEMMNCDVCKRPMVPVTASATDEGEDVNVIPPSAKEMRNGNGKCAPEAMWFDPTPLARVKS